MGAANASNVTDLNFNVSRGLRKRDMREYDVDRKSILSKAIREAVEHGYEFEDHNLPYKRRAEKAQQAWREKQSAVEPQKRSWWRRLCGW